MVDLRVVFCCTHVNETLRIRAPTFLLNDNPRIGTCSIKMAAPTTGTERSSTNSRQDMVPRSAVDCGGMMWRQEQILLKQAVEVSCYSGPFYKWMVRELEGIASKVKEHS
jgi:hypothetical protein